jgi:tRNA A-37 threonylcarbamoyl transferase component Bud32
MAMDLGREAGSVSIPGYEVRGLIGRGAMSSVYRANQVRVGRDVALKVLSRRSADDERLRQAFLRESQVLAELDHPNVVPVYDAGEENGSLYLAMRLVSGPDLAELIRQSSGLDPQRTIAIGRQLADAIDAAHEAGLVHRDIKPANVMLETDDSGADHVFLCDFGLGGSVAAPDPDRTDLDSTLGTANYSSPEQIAGGSVGPASDIYSFACLLFECLTGRVPYSRDNVAAVAYAHMEETPPSVVALRADLPAAVDAVLARGLAKDPAERPASARALVEELVSAGDGAIAAPATSTITPAVVVPRGGSGRGEPPFESGAARRRTNPWRQSARAMLVAVPVILLAAAIAVFGVLQHDATAVPGAVERALTPVKLPNGLVLSGKWALAGKDGSVLQVTTTIANNTNRPVAGFVDDVVPGSLATSIRDLHFLRTTPPHVEGSGRPLVLRWDFRDKPLAARSLTHRYFNIDVPVDGREVSRLDAWAGQRLGALRSHLSGDIQLLDPASLRSSPTAPFTLVAGQGVRVSLTGRYKDSSAPVDRAMFVDTVWTSARRHVARVQAIKGDGFVVGVSPGVTTIRAQVGEARLALRVKVVPPGTSSSTPPVNLLPLLDLDDVGPPAPKAFGAPPAVNHKPVAADDIWGTGQNQGVRIPVLRNDADPDGDTLSIVHVSRADHGKVTCRAADTLCTYQPERGFHGIDHFTYTDADRHGARDSAAVTVAVSEHQVPNRKPVTRDDAVEVGAGEKVTVRVTANDFDPDVGDRLHVKDNHDTTNLGRFHCSGTTCRFTAGDSIGTVAFPYAAADQHDATAVGIVHVTVVPRNQAPLTVIGVDLAPIASLGVGETAQLGVMFTMSDGTQRVGNGYTPSSDHPEYADANGTAVTGVGAGVATITVSYANPDGSTFTDSKEVTVTAPDTTTTTEDPSATTTTEDPSATTTTEDPSATTTTEDPSATTTTTEDPSATTTTTTEDTTSTEGQTDGSEPVVTTGG